MMYESWECSETEIIFCHFQLFFTLSPTIFQKFEKNYKNLKDIILDICTINDNHYVWFLRYRMRQTEFFVFWGIFCPFTPPPLRTQKIKFLKKNEKKSEILSFYTCVLYMSIISCVAPEIGVQQTECSVLWVIFCPFILTNNPEN